MAQTALGGFGRLSFSYAALVHPALKDEMQRVERLSTAETNAGLIETVQAQHFGDLFWIVWRMLGTAGRAPCLAARVRPTHQIENSKATLELASIRFLWRHACEARGVRA